MWFALLAFSHFILYSAEAGRNSLNACRVNSWSELGPLEKAAQSLRTQVPVGVAKLIPLKVTIRGKLKDVRAVTNCLAYRFCGDQKELLSGDLDHELTNEITLKLSRDEIDSLPKSCPWRDFEAEVKIQDTYSALPKNEQESVSLTRDALRAQPLSRNEREDYYASVAPIALKVVSPMDQKAALEQADRAIAVKHFDRAASLLMKTFGITAVPYHLSFHPDPNNEETAQCVTHPAQLEINCVEPSDPCILMSSLRHELEHVQQFKKRDFCMNQETGSLFDDHRSRERSVYLNDLAKLGEYCPRKNAKFLAEQLKTTVQKAYWTDAASK